MNNLMQLDIACASLDIQDAIDELGKYWSGETEHYYVTFNRKDIEKAEEHLYDAMSLLSEFFSQAHVDHIESNRV